MTDDIVVVGGGLEGYLTALSAKRADAGAAVRVLAREGRFDTESGLIDVLGYRSGDGDPEPVTDPISAIADLPAAHRYAELGPDAVREALSLFDDATGGRYAGDATTKNALFPTATGHVTPAARYPDSFAAGLASADEPMRLVGFERVADFNAELAVDRLDERFPYDVAGTTVTTSMAVAEPPVAPEMASLLDEESTPRKDLAETLAPVLDTEPRVGLPAVLGERNADAIRADLDDALHAAVFEIPLGPPSVPGRRLEALLRDALADHDVAVERGVSLTGVETKDGEVVSVSAQGSTPEAGESTTYEASSFVLATGGVGDRGLAGSGRDLAEPVFDCPVAVPESGNALATREFLGDHPAIRAGVETDEALRPVDADGGALYENLHAAGTVLRSSNVVAERSAAGVSIATGFEAGRRAVE